jgi:hypothetical protein
LLELQSFEVNLEGLRNIPTLIYRYKIVRNFFNKKFLSFLVMDEDPDSDSTNSLKSGFDTTYVRVSYLSSMKTFGTVLISSLRIESKKQETFPIPQNSLLLCVPYRCR